MDKVTATILKSMDSQGYADDTIRKMKITLTELLVNALDHGNNKEPTRKVTVGHVVDNHQAKIAIMDEGGGFSPDTVPDPTLPENLIKDSGRGLFIVRCYVDDISFNEKGNRVTIVKRFE
jgi:serine/threonine-protein kinase RsbW